MPLVRWQEDDTSFHSLSARVEKNFSTLPVWAWSVASFQTVADFQSQPVPITPLSPRQNEVRGVLRADHGQGGLV